MAGEGEGKEGTLFFCFRSDFRAVTRLETLATQANMSIAISHARTRNALLIIEHKLCKTRCKLFSLKIACSMGS